jgi:hypothetical protein
MTILDPYGRPLRRTIGFLARYEVVKVAKPLIGGLQLVGFDVPLEPEDGDEDAQRSSPRVIR